MSVIAWIQLNTEKMWLNFTFLKWLILPVRNHLHAAADMLKIAVTLISVRANL